MADSGLVRYNPTTQELFDDDGKVAIVTAVEDAVDEAVASITTFASPKGAWAAGISYPVNSIVTNGGSSYLAPAAVPARAVFAASDWTALGAGGVSLADVANAIANPETTLNTNVVAQINAIVTPATLVAVDAPLILTGGNINTARPVLPSGAPYPGPVRWYSQLGRPTFYNSSKGDTWRAISVDPVPFSPNDLASLFLWFNPLNSKKTDGTSAGNGDAIATVLAAGSAGVGFAQATTAKQPVLSLAGLAGGPAASFDGTDDNLRSAAYPTQDSRGTVEYLMVGGGDAAVSTSARFIYDHAGVATSISGGAFRASSNVWGYSRGTTTNSGTASDASPHLLKIVHDTAATNAATMYVDGVAVITAGAVGNRYTSTSEILGSRGDDANFHKGFIGHKLRLSAPPTSTEETNIKAWFKSQYPAWTLY